MPGALSEGKKVKVYRCPVHPTSQSYAEGTTCDQEIIRCNKCGDKPTFNNMDENDVHIDCGGTFEIRRCGRSRVQI